jgi:hypothetical protein
MVSQIPCGATSSALRGGQQAKAIPSERAAGHELTPRCAAPVTGEDTRHDAEARGRQRLSPALQIPKNRSTGNLGTVGDSSEKARIRFSFDAGAAAAEYDAMSRSA